MSQYSRLSIWENDPHHMSWYDHVVGRKTPAEPFITPSTEMNGYSTDEMLLPTDDGLQGVSWQQAWFNELKRSDDQKQAKTPEQSAPLTSMLANSNVSHAASKFQQQKPYFEYMFADAGLDTSSDYSGNSIDKLSFDKVDSEKVSARITTPEVEVCEASSPSEWQPGTPQLEGAEPQVIDVSFLHRHEYVDACMVDVDPVISEYPSVSIDLAAEDYRVDADKKRSRSNQANIHIFHAGSCSGVKQRVSNVIADYTTRVDEPTPSLSLRRTARPKSKFVLKPKSQKEKLQKALVHGYTRISKPKTTIERFGIVKASQKRKAVRPPAIDYNASGRNQVKKQCLMQNKTLDTETVVVTPLSSVFEISAFSDTSSCRVVSVDFFSHRPLAVAPKGYAGQFDGLVIKKNCIADFKYNLTPNDAIKSEIHHTFGDTRHPNGVFTHTSINVDPLRSVPDFTKESLPVTHPLVTCMNFATDMTIAAAHSNVVKLRNHDEEILRREAHIECARSRLEGVSVGYYRYYQGHLSIEEYHDAEMCIC